MPSSFIRSTMDTFQLSFSGLALAISSSLATTSTWGTAAGAPVGAAVAAASAAGWVRVWAMASLAKPSLARMVLNRLMVPPGLRVGGKSGPGGAGSFKGRGKKRRRGRRDPSSPERCIALSGDNAP